MLDNVAAGGLTSVVLPVSEFTLKNACKKNIYQYVFCIVFVKN
jgi:hypothetical protein